MVLLVLFGAMVLGGRHPSVTSEEKRRGKIIEIIVVLKWLMNSIFGSTVEAPQDRCW